MKRIYRVWFRIFGLLTLFDAGYSVKVEHLPVMAELSPQAQQLLDDMKQDTEDDFMMFRTTRATQSLKAS